MFRDYGLLQARIDDLHREASGLPVRPFVTLDPSHGDPRPNRVSSGAAAVARWVGRASIGIANRLDSSPADREWISTSRHVPSR